jgi:hypothetical protein
MQPHPLGRHPGRHLGQQTATALRIAAAALALLQPAAAFAEDREGAAAGQAAPSAAGKATPDVAARGPALPALPRFVPRDRGAPTSRLGGATRGAAADELPAVEALVPAEVGLTLEPRPVLYWYLSRASDVRVDLRLLALDPLETVLETRLPAARAGGIQRIRLADHGVELAPGRTYQWLVLLVPDPADRSYDRVVGGGIERIAPDARLRDELAAADRERLPFVLAQAGVWYDAIDVLSREIEKRPADVQLWNRRAALFEQVGLPEVPLEASEAAPGFGSR